MIRWLGDLKKMEEQSTASRLLMAKGKWKTGRYLYRWCKVSLGEHRDDGRVASVCKGQKGVESPSANMSRIYAQPCLQSLAILFCFCPPALDLGLITWWERVALHAAVGVNCKIGQTAGHMACVPS